MTEVLFLLVGYKINQARKEMKLTQEQLANIAEVSRTSVTNIESGNQRLQLDTLYRIAYALKKPIEFFLPEVQDGLLMEREKALIQLIQTFKVTPKEG